MVKLTQPTIDKYRATGKRRLIRDSGSRSLYLVIAPSGAKSWMMRFRRPDGRPAKIVLGPVHSGNEVPGPAIIGMPLTLAGAHLVAADVLRRREQGEDVIGDHKAKKHRQRSEEQERSASTFAACARDYITEHARPKTRHWREVARILGLDYGKDGGEPTEIKGGLAQRWADKPVDKIDGHDVWEVTDEAKRVSIPGIVARTKGLSNARARAQFVALSGFFGWCKRERRIKINPCAGEERPPAPKARETVLTTNEIRWFWQATETATEPFKSIYRLLLLTGQRLNEVAGMTWDELSDDGATWSLLGHRTKNGRAHVVPLPPLACDIITSVKRKPGVKLLFTTTGVTPPSGWNRASDRLRAKMDALAQEERGPAIQDFVLHDLRRTAVTGLVELGFPPHVVELIVNHISGARSGVAGTYNRSKMLDERRAALERWAVHVAGIVSGGTDNVVSFPAVS